MAELTNITEAMYSDASVLADKGFGSFERCLHILSICEGSKEEAEQTLSKIILKDERVSR